MAYTTIDNPELYFQTVLYSGNNTSQSITLDGDEDMQPDFVWIKERNGTEQHNLFDSVRGSTKRLQSDSTNAEWDSATNITSFNSDGFSIGSSDAINDSGNTQVAWCWKESAVSGFDIVSYEGNASGGTHSHSLSAVPHFMTVKNFDASDQNWGVYHQSLGGTKYLELNNTGAVASDIGGYERWNSTAPTSSVFSAGPSDTTDESSHTHIAYLWSEKQGYSKFGSYTGNANADGPFIYTGFRPAMVILKNTAGTHNWQIMDNKRKPANPVDGLLKPNASTAEQDPSDAKDFLSNGFKIKNSAAENNGSGNTFIYMAFAEAPFVNSNGVPCNAR